MSLRQLLLDSFQAAVAAACPERVLPGNLPPPPLGITYVVGAGKAAAAMAATVEGLWPETAPLQGLVITRHGHGCATRRITVVEAGHPLPNQLGLTACRYILGLVQRAQPDDLILALLSGGGSSLLTLPEPGLSLDDIRSVTHDLLCSGASIHEINIVRKCLSRMLGGKLASLSRAPVHVLAISDVVGDELGTIASGPFGPATANPDEALAILEHWGIKPIATVVHHLQQGGSARRSIQIDFDNSRKALITSRIVASAHDAMEGAAHFFRERDIEPILLSDHLSGDSRETGRQLAALAQNCHPKPEKQFALLSGGETTVRVTGTGKGGRNTELLLSLALHLDGLAHIHALAADTDGIDGTEHNAGALASPDTLSRAKALGLNAQAALKAHDAYSYFASLGDLVVTGPTRTNVNDYRAILLAAPARR